MTFRLTRFSRLQWALLASVLVHAVLLSVRFVDPDRLQQLFQNETLEVVLVNAAARDAPDEAQALAQHNLEGGGEAEDKHLASTPLPPNTLESDGDSVIDQNRRQIEQMLEQQELLLAQVQEQLARLNSASRTGEQGELQAQADEERRQQLLKMLATIERRIDEENSRPRKRFLSPATLGVTYAQYYDDMRRKIEETGTLNFPQVAGRKLYGELLMAMLVNHDGRILDARVVKSSGDRVLDRLAEAIAQKSAPFGPFTPAMRRDTDQFDITARFRFTHEQTLETTLEGDAPAPQIP